MSFKTFCDTTGIWFKNHAPELLIGGGFALSVGAAIVAVCQTPKAMKAIDDAKSNIEVYNKCAENGQGIDADGNVVPYTAENAALDIKRTKFQCTKACVKTYAIPVLMEVGAAIMTGFGIKEGKEAYVVAVADATSATVALTSLRSNIRKRYGAKAEQELLAGKWAPETKEVQKQVVNPETGEIETKTETVTDDGNGTKVDTSMYDREFNQTCPMWDECPAATKVTLDAAQRYFNDLLQGRTSSKHPGWVLLSEVYDYLGFRVTQESTKVGWIRTGKEACPVEIKLGYDDPFDPVNGLFLKGLAKNPVLRFNVQGPILGAFPKI